MTAPNFIIAGAPKCGTTSVFSYIGAHPNVCASNKKETYFLMDSVYPLYNNDCNFDSLGLNGYSSFFSSDGELPQKKVIMEATPDYLYQKEIFSKIQCFTKLPKVLIVLRKPSHRIFSLYNFAKNIVCSLDSRISFPEFIEKIEKTECFSNDLILSKAINHSRYIEYLRPWQKLFGNKLKVMIFEDLVENPKNFMEELSDFLNLDKSFYDNYSFEKKNNSRIYRIRLLQQLSRIIKKTIGNDISNQGWVKPFKPIGRFLFVTLNTSKKKIRKTDEDISCLNYLDELFREPNDRLAKELHLNLEKWS